jgi:hypothetical protein
MLLRCRWLLMTALLIFGLTAHSKNATPVEQPGAPPQILQIYREFWKPGSVAANRNIEAEASQICVELRCPHPYLGLESLTGPKEAWFLNGYVSSTEQTQVGEDYQKNSTLIQALNEILIRKKPLSRADDVNVFAEYRQSLSHGAPWRVGEGRFLVITVIKSAVSARSNPVVDGSAFEADDGTRFVISAAGTRQEADARAAKAGRETRVFAVRPYWSLPAKDWIAMDPSFWRHHPPQGAHNKFSLLRLLGSLYVPVATRQIRVSRSDLGTNIPTPATPSPFSGFFPPVTLPRR